MHITLDHAGEPSLTHFFNIAFSNVSKVPTVHAVSLYITGRKLTRMNSSILATYLSKQGCSPVACDESRLASQDFTIGSQPSSVSDTYMIPVE